MEQEGNELPDISMRPPDFHGLCDDTFIVAHLGSDGTAAIESQA